MKKFYLLLLLLLLAAFGAIPHRAEAQFTGLNCENTPSIVQCSQSAGPANTGTGDALYVVGGKLNFMLNQIYNSLGTGSNFQINGVINAADIVRLFAGTPASSLCLGSQGSLVACSGGGGGGGTPGGSSGQLQYNNAGIFGGFTVSGDGALNPTTGVITVTKTAGTLFGTLATATTATPVIALFSGTADASHCLSGAATLVACAGGSGGTPGGTNGQIQYNNSGSFGGLTLNGSGAPVGTTGASMISPNLGTPSAVVLTNASGFPYATGGTGQLPFANMNLTSANIISLWTGSCNASTYLRGDGSCVAPTGSGTVSNGTGGYFAYYGATGTTVNPLAPQDAVTNLNCTANQQSGTAYNVVLADRNCTIVQSNSAANTVTILPHSSVALPVNGTIMVQEGAAGVTSTVAGSGVTFTSLQYGTTLSSYPLRGANDFDVWYQQATDNWLLVQVGPTRYRGVQAISAATSMTPAPAYFQQTDMSITAAAGAFTVNNPSVACVNGDVWTWHPTSTNIQNITWGSGYHGSTANPLPSQTSGSSESDYFGFRCNGQTGKEDYVAGSLGY